MADTIQTPEVVNLEVKKDSRWKTFTTNHPRTAKVAAITAAAVAVVGVVFVVKSLADSDETPTTDEFGNEITSSPETNLDSVA